MSKEFILNLQEELTEYIQNINLESLDKASKLIINIKKNGGRVHLTGIGKPSYVAKYIASLLSSTGTPAYFLDGTEAIHGSSGQVSSNDVVIAISNSGETDELKKTILTLKKIGVKIIGVAGNNESWLSEKSDIFLFAGVNIEGDSLNKPPRLSILAEMIILQCLSIDLQEDVQLDENTYYKWHPGGALGASIKKEED